MISYKCYSNPHVLMTRSNASKDSSRGFQVSSEISFSISARKILPTSGQTIDVICDQKFSLTLTNGSGFAFQLEWPVVLCWICELRWSWRLDSKLGNWSMLNCIQERLNGSRFRGLWIAMQSAHIMESAVLLHYSLCFFKSVCNSNI